MEQPKVALADIEAQITEWLPTQSGQGNEQLIGEMLRTVLRLAHDEASRGDLKILNRTLKELRHAFKLFAPYTAVRKVSIFGSTRITETEPHYLLAKEVGQRLTEEGFMVITGAGPGVMQAGHEGAGREKSFGVNIRLPFAQKANRFIRGDPKLMHLHFFFTRKLILVKEADAVVIFPGGFGTHDELTEALTLSQTGKGQLVPIVLMDVPGGTYWKEWEGFMRGAVLSRGYISERDLSLFKIVNTVDGAINEIRTFYRNYHSYRFVKQDLVIRLNYPPTPNLIDTLNREFAHILTGEKIKQTEPLPEESGDVETLHLHRLLVPFNREDFASLRLMVDVINGAD
jgi:uncharacterized protein (TIGR00730 family)